jgi:hypothetical protein
VPPIVTVEVWKYKSERGWKCLRYKSPILYREQNFSYKLSM